MSRLKDNFFSGLIVALIAALVTGAFTLIPWAIDNYNDKKSLRYWVNQSLVLTAQPNKQMFFVEIENTGSKPIFDIIYEFELESAVFDDVSIESPLGVTTSYSVDSESIRVNIDELNPDETTRITYLATGDLSDEATADVEPTLRADELSANDIMSGPPEMDGRSFLGIFLPLFIYAAIISKLFPLIRQYVFGNLGVIDKEISLSYIWRLVFSDDVSNLPTSTGTFTGDADLIFLLAKQGSINPSKARTFLLCLLRCNYRMAPSARKIIIRHLHHLPGNEEFNIQEIVVPKTKDIRTDFEKIFQEFAEIERIE